MFFCSSAAHSFWLVVLRETGVRRGPEQKQYRHMVVVEEGLGLGFACIDLSELMSEDS